MYYWGWQGQCCFSFSSLDQMLISSVLQQIWGGWCDFSLQAEGNCQVKSRAAGKEACKFSGTHSMLEGGRSCGKHFMHFPFEDDVVFKMWERQFSVLLKLKEKKKTTTKSPEFLATPFGSRNISKAHLKKRLCWNEIWIEIFVSHILCPSHTEILF